MVVPRATCIWALQPCEGIICSSLLSESIVQSELQPVCLVYCIPLCHALDNFLYKLGCLLCLQPGAQMFPAHHYDLGLPKALWVQNTASVLTQFETYWDANSEKVSVMIFSSVTFFLMSSNARSTRVVICSYM